ncbi:MAG: PKD domain-containing protein, partial [Candidatus Thermoplasmatota archaeon]|nr:PKD domain-containing protein [Candidatus Thermoplasmatota archaeon]
MLIISVLVPPGVAVKLDPGVPSNTTPTQGEVITFSNVNLTIESHEAIPVNYLNFTIKKTSDDSYVDHIKFYLNGNVLSGGNPSGKFAIINTNYVSTIPFSDSYGYGYDWNLGYGYDFNFGYGYGPNSGVLTILYDITFHTINLNKGTSYYAMLYVYSDDGTTSHLFSSDPSLTFTIKTKSTVSGGGGTVVTNTPPVADAGGPYIGYLDQTVTFNGQNSYDTDGTIVNWTWNIGNGIILYGETPTYTFTSNDDIGSYAVTLTVKDNYGATDSDATTIEVKETQVGDQLPIAITNGPYIAIVDQDITLDASASYDPDGTIEDYKWILGDGSTVYGKIITHSYT